MNGRTGNVLIEFDPALIDEPSILTLIAAEPTPARRRARRSPPPAATSPVTVLERDKHSRGIRVATRGRIGDRDIQFIARYRFPSPNRVVFAQVEGELDAVRGSWAFRSVGGSRTRATYLLEVKPGWRLSLMRRGALYEQIRAAVLDHIMSELRERVESRG